MPPVNANSPPGPTPSIFVRTADLNDLPAIVALEQTAPFAAHWPAEHYQSRIQGEPPSACFLVAESRDAENKSQLSGFLCARIVSGEWEIENVVVHPTFRRQRIATQLLGSLIELWQVAAGATLLLEVRESNAVARALYERHGFRETGRRPAYYRDPKEPAVLYTLQPHEPDTSGTT
ncbi:MAG: ribosomal protein S18-alanine N-acetyltransferase [Terriglobales bacterium]